MLCKLRDVMLRTRRNASSPEAIKARLGAITECHKHLNSASAADTVGAVQQTFTQVRADATMAHVYTMGHYPHLIYHARPTLSTDSLACSRPRATNPQLVGLVSSVAGGPLRPRLRIPAELAGLMSGLGSQLTAGLKDMVASADFTESLRGMRPQDSNASCRRAYHEYRASHVRISF